MPRSRPSVFVLVGLLGILGVLAGACAGNGDAAAPRADVAAADFADADVVLTAGDMFYEGAPASLEAGTHVIGLDNQGRAPHDVVFDRGIGQVAYADGGAQAAGEVTLEAGDYVVYCSIPGHRQAGMEFDLTVE
ncbi:plastocyanin/azurin family copper-binding protein [Egicoccus sp. AB-alg2]|uniref:plastocyanin/azurin family copper-binding protein n=1 Tax=Egicoccus sp. AB-alg2 TaxID=3242693 RepID=UPI00359EAE08